MNTAWMECVKQLPGELTQRLPLSQYTSWRAGGSSQWAYRPASLEDCQTLLSHVPADVPVTWLGLGSNTLVRDGGLPGLLVITQGRLATLKYLGEDKHEVLVEAGVSCAQVARFCARHDLAGAEFLAGVPGTMGGALAMNAGCFGCETWDLVRSATLIDRHGVLHEYMPADFTIRYRHVVLPEDMWFVSAKLGLLPGDKATALGKIRTLLDRRAKTQPTSDHSCGSVFCNPSHDYAGRLIEAAGLKGYQVGGAEVSLKHANFIVNRGLATALDIEQLIQHVQAAVAEKFGIVLQTEVKIIGQLASE